MNSTQKPPFDSASRRSRRWFWALGGAGALAGMLSCVGMARAQGWHHHAGWGAGTMDPEVVARRVEGVTQFVLWRIDATPEQRTRITAIARDAARDLMPLRAAHRAAREEVLTVLGAETVDRAALERLRVAELQRADEASKRLTEAVADAAEALDPARRAQLLAHLQARMGRRV